MKSMICLLNGGTDVHAIVSRLLEVGIIEGQIRQVTTPKAICRLLGCDPAALIQKYALLGAAVGIGIYAVTGAAAGLCQCNLMQYGMGYGIGAFLILPLFGSFAGGFIGFLIGVAEAETDTHLYVQGIRLGGRAIVIQVAEEDIERVRLALAGESVSGLKLLPSEHS